jgi:hypothetical protein
MRVLLFVTTFACIGCALSTHADDVPKGAEVHYVAVSQPQHQGLSRDEITDWQGLVKALRVKDGPAAYIRKQLPKDSDEVLTEEVENGKLENFDADTVARLVKFRFVVDFTQAIRKRVFYDPEVFDKVEMPKHVKQLADLGEKRTTLQTARLNREILSLVFPKCIAPTPDDFQTVHVTVKAGKPVVLVLSAYHQTHWKVKVEKGAAVTSVILLGNYAKEVSGTDAPVDYLAEILPTGKRSGHSGFNAMKMETVEYERLVKLVKDQTGKELTSFQAHYQSEKEPFVITPSAK